MAWVCEYCSTTNENKTDTCFVCDMPRSKASLLAEREAKRREREAWMAAKREAILTNAIRYGTRLTWIFETLGIIILIAILALRVRSGYVSEIIPSILMAFKMLYSKVLLIGGNIVTACMFAFTGLFLRFQFSPIWETIILKIQNGIANLIVIYNQIFNTINAAIQKGINK